MRTIETTEEAVLRIVRGEAMYIGDRRLDPGWSQNWSIATIKRLVGQRRMFTTCPPLTIKIEET